MPALLLIVILVSGVFRSARVSDAGEENILNAEEQRESRLTDLPGDEDALNESLSGNPDSAPDVVSDGNPDRIEDIVNPGIITQTDEEKADAWIREHGIYAQSEYIDISHIDISDVDIDMIISRLPNVKRLVMCDCGLDNDGYAALQDRHPDIKIVFEIVLDYWTIRTDVVAFSTFKTTAEEFYMNNDDAYYLKYCNELVALDLGHNYVSDLSFLEYMPDLKVLILVDNEGKRRRDSQASYRSFGSPLLY